MKQSTFSAVMANSIKNLLQRYTKGIRFTAILTLLFTIGVGQMLGAHTVVKASEMVSGEKYIITADYNGKTYYLKPASFAEGGSSAVAYTTNLTDAAAWTFTKSGNIWEISTTISGKEYYLGHNSKNNGVKSVNPKNNGDYTIVASTSGSGATTVKMTANSRDLALYQGTNWRCYSSDNGVKTITLYKVESATPTLTATPTSLNFGEVAKNASLEIKTFSISGSNLTSGNLSISAPTGYSVSPESVSVNGTLSSTEITVTPNTSTAGTYNDNITISGGGLTSDVKVEVKMTVLETYTITWIVNGETKHTNSATHGGSVTAPNVDPIPCGDVIAGWTDAKDGEYIHGNSPLYKGAKANITNITSDKTFYAVFADYAD